MAEKKEAKTIEVTVKEIPVRYNGVDYEPGDKLEIEEKYFDELTFTKK